MSIICPDYATRWVESEQRTVYTFDGLGSGIGLVAKRALEAHQALWRFLTDLGKPARFVLAIADQEANEANCARVGVDRAEFLARLRLSQSALAQAAPKGMVLETPFLSELLDPAKWESALAAGRKITDRVRQGEYAVAMRRALGARRHFYCKWAGRELSTVELQEMILGQVPEYIALGAYFMREAPNTFMLGADSPDMGSFVRAAARSTLPLLYLDRASY